jgi:hypothetical protein
MAYGEVEYDESGKPICEICGKAFKRILVHAKQKHDITAREYKLMFGLDVKKGICSKESRELSRERALENYDVVIKENLLEAGKVSRFKEGSKGRTKEQVSAQTKKMLKQRLLDPRMIKAMKEAGKKVGKSGLGNLSRWGSKD